MKIQDFGVEQWMNAYETKAVYNLGETCVSPFSIKTLIDTTGGDVESFCNKLLNTRLTYGAIEGASTLKKEISSLYKDISLAEIVTNHGAIGSNSLVINTIVEPGDEVIVVTPTYQQMQSIPEALGAVTKFLHLKPENKYLPDVEELKSLVNEKTKLIVVNNPNNPSGSLMDKNGLINIVNIAKVAGAYILCDEVYRNLTQQDGYNYSIVDLYEKGISTSSFSKVFSLAGIRLGWVATHDQKLIKQFLSHRDYSTISCGVIDEMIGTYALQHKDIILERNKAIIRKNLKILEQWVEAEPHISWYKPQAGTTTLLYYDFDIGSREFCDRLMNEYKTLLVPGSCFDIEYSLRLGYAFESEHLKNGLACVSQFLKKLDEEKTAIR